MAQAGTTNSRASGGGAELPSELACDLVVIGFAVWTVWCHVCVLSGLSFSTLVAGATVALAIAAAAGWWYRRRGLVSLECSPEGGDKECPPISGRATLFAVGVAAVGCAGIFALSDWRPVWWLLVGYFAILWWTGRAGTPRFEQPVPSPGKGWGLASLAALCAVLTLIAHRPDSDDCLYLNFAVAAVDSPHEPMMTHDTLHGDATLELALPIYRVHSFELLAGVISSTTGLPVIKVDHVVFPPLLAVMACLAWAGLLRLVAPRHWPSVLVAVVAVYLTFGADHRWYSNFAFVRIFQGKAALLTMGVPLIIRAALRLRMAPTWVNWALLAASQVAAVGLSSTGLWLAPGIAALTTLAVAPKGWMGLAYASRGLSASWYPVLLALFLKSQMKMMQAELYEIWTWQQIAEIMFGDGRLRYATLIALVLAWRAVNGSLGRRLAVLLPLFALLTLLNPYLASWVGSHVVGTPAYFRAIWILPVPLFLAAVLAWPAVAGWPRFARWGVLGACILLVPPFWELSEKNRVHLGWPSLKVEEDYRSAAVLARRPSLAREHVLAPTSVALWLPTFHHHPYPLISREGFLNNYRGERLPERHRRTALAAYVSGLGDSSEGAALLVESFTKDQLRAVCLQRQSPWVAEAEASLRKAGFKQFHTNAKYEFWEKDAERSSSH